MQAVSRPGRVASILWMLAFENLGTLVTVTAQDVAALPWGGARRRGPMARRSS
jgi:hypothetical protein